MILTSWLLGVTGRLQVAEGVVHIIAESFWKPDFIQEEPEEGRVPPRFQVERVALSACHGYLSEMAGDASKGGTMSYWLAKSDPDTYGWPELLRDGRTSWDGVRNFTARNNLRAMKPETWFSSTTRARRNPSSAP